MEKQYSRFLARIGTIGEFFVFLWRRRLWWMIPMFLVLAIFVILLVFAQSSSLAPFIYTLF
jgi:drug/metabolite transporter superfamily protein YnfA